MRLKGKVCEVQGGVVIDDVGIVGGLMMLIRVGMKV